jgi:hypothetical protein
LTTTTPQACDNANQHRGGNRHGRKGWLDAVCPRRRRSVAATSPIEKRTLEVDDELRGPELLAGVLLQGEDWRPRRRGSTGNSQRAFAHIV